MEILIPPSFCKSLSFINANMHLLSNAFLVTTIELRIILAIGTSEMDPMVAISWYWCSYIMGALLVWGPGNPLLINREQQRWWDVTSKSRLQKLWFPYCSHALAFLLTCSKEAIHHVVSHPMERSICKELNPDKNHITGLRKRSIPALPQVKPSDETKGLLDRLTIILLRTSSQRHPVLLGLDSWSVQSMK